MSGYYVLSPAACFPPSRSVLAAVSLWSMATNSAIYPPAPFGISWSWSFVLLCFVTLALAEVQDADDTNPGMFYTGIWTPDGDPNAFGSHDTWTNQSGASVSFDFIGTQVSVFVTRRPIGTYLTNASFSIDGGPPTFWTTSDPVPAISYKNLVYTSRSLSRAQHRITVTNLGKFFWLDYMEYTVAGASASVISTPTQDPMGTDSGLSSVVTRPTGAVSPAVAAASTSSRTAMIVGIVVGVLGGVALLVSVLWWLRMRSQARQREIESLAATPFAGHGQSQRSASNGAKTLSPHLGFARTSEKDVERGAHEVVPHLLACDDNSIAGVAPSSATVGHSEIILEAIPDDGGQLSTRTGPRGSPACPRPCTHRRLRALRPSPAPPGSRVRCRCRPHGIVILRSHRPRPLQSCPPTTRLRLQAERAARRRLRARPGRCISACCAVRAMVACALPEGGRGTRAPIRGRRPRTTMCLKC
ncbi:hypothetical protein C2E23DRAFT_432275 [Lenzites betulinus]|nr:hypothetical protein C2E23DRAFT_432275 [Lenzites betulinus]